MDTKTCTYCSETKPYSEFYKKKSMKDGHRSECKSCSKIQNDRYVERNTDKVKENRRKYKEEHREEIRKKDAEYRAKNIEDCRRRSREHARKNRASRSEYGKQYYIKNKAYVSARNRAYRQKYPEKIVAKSQRRRARAASLVSNFTNEQWEISLKYFDNKCCYCGKADGDTHQEHFVPVSKNGGYTVSNIVPACSNCNLSKGTKDFEEWYFTKKEHNSELAKKIFQYFYWVCNSEVA